MTAVWPATLPTNFQADGFQFQPASLLVRTPMEAGPPKVRRRSTAGVGMLKGTVWLTGDQRATLLTFFTDTLEGGALQFDWTDPVTGDAATYRFKQPPQFGYMGGDTHVAVLDLEVMP